MANDEINAILKLLWTRIETERNAAKAKAAGSPTKDINMAMAHQYAAEALADARYEIHSNFAGDWPDDSN